MAYLGIDVGTGGTRALVIDGRGNVVASASGENFDVSIPAFSLDSPHQSGRVH